MNPSNRGKFQASSPPDTGLEALRSHVGLLGAADAYLVQMTQQIGGILVDAVRSGPLKFIQQGMAVNCTRC